MTFSSVFVETRLKAAIDVEEKRFIWQLEEMINCTAKFAGIKLQ